MSNAPTALIGLAALAFLLAVYAAFLTPIAGLGAEALSRASSNLALIAIALLLASKGGSQGAA